MAMSAKQRKPTAGFVNDNSALNLMQISPRAELYLNERSPYTMASHSSKTNFIGDSVIADGPRAVAIDGAGERHSIILEDEMLPTTTNPFTNSPRPYHARQQPIKSSSSQIVNVGSASGDRTRTCCTKRSKPARRHINQKQRLIFTPRNVERQISNQHLPDFKPRVQHYNATTQTDVHSKATNQPNVHRATSMIQHTTPLKAPQISTPLLASQSTAVKLPRRYARDTVGDMLDSPRRRPLRILPRENSAMKHELRNIASALTLITVVSWLFSIFFELEGIVDMLGHLLHSIQVWYTKKEKPMTKAEMFFDYIRSFWF